MSSLRFGMFLCCFKRNGPLRLTCADLSVEQTMFFYRVIRLGLGSAWEWKCWFLWFKGALNAAKHNKLNSSAEKKLVRLLVCLLCHPCLILVSSLLRRCVVVVWFLCLCCLFLVRLLYVSGL